MKRALSLSAALFALMAMAAPRAFASCGSVISPGPGALQGAINTVTGIGPGDCVIQLNSGTYNETITIPNTITFVDKFSRLIISSAPGAAVLISSSNSGAPLIDIGLDSVTLMGVSVAANAATTIGVNASGNLVTLSSVTVIDSMTYFSQAGAEIGGHYDQVLNSSITSQGTLAYGLFLTSNSSGSLVSMSTATNSSTGGEAALEVDASSVTVDSTFAQALASNNALQIQGNPNTLWVTNSSFTANTGYAGYLNTAAGVVLSNDGFSSTSDALRIVNAGSNQVLNSTMTTSSGYGIYVNTAGNSFSASNINEWGTTNAAVDVDGGGNSNSFKNILINSKFDGFQINGGASGTTISASTVTCSGGSGRALAIVSGSNLQLSDSVLWNSGLSNAMEIDAGGGGVQIARSSITTTSGGSNRALYIAQPNTTISDSWFSSNFGAAIMIDNVSGALISKSTMTSDSNAEGTMYFANNANGSTVTLSSMFNGRGDALLADGSDSNNTVSQSTIASNGGGGVNGAAVHFIASANNDTISGSVILGRAPSGPAVLFQNSSASNTITTSFVTAAVSGALRIDPGPHNIKISFSTVTAASTSGAVSIVSSSMNVLDNDYLQNPPGDALLMTGANYNTVTNSTATNATTVTYAALRLIGSSSNTFTGDFFVAPSGIPVTIQNGSNYNAISQSTMTTSAFASVYTSVTNCVGNSVDHSYLGAYALGGSIFWVNSGVSNFTVSQSTLFVTNSNGSVGSGLNIANSTFTYDYIFTGNGTGLDINGAIGGMVLSNLRIDASTGVVVRAGYNGLSIVGSTITSSGVRSAGLALQSVSNVAISGSSITASGLNGYGVSDIGGTNNSVTGSGVTSWQGAGLLADGSSGLGLSASTVYGSTGALVVNAPAGSTVTVSGSTLTATSPAAYALSFSGSGSAVVSLGGVVDIHGEAFVAAGGLLASGWTSLGGDLTLGPSVFTTVSGSTIVFAGASETPLVTAQTLTVQATPAPAFDSLQVNVASFSARGLSFNAKRFQDLVAGSTAAFAAGTTPPYTLTTLALAGGTGANGRINFRSLVPGVQSNVYINDLSGSTVTLAQITDSNQNFSPISANDGSSIDGGDNTNWNFLPALDIELPGESWSEGVGKVGSPSNDTAGPVTVTVRATSSGNTTVTGSSIPVTLWGSDVYDSTMTQTLVNGTTTFSLPLRRAEPSPYSHMLTAVSTGAYNATPYVYYDFAPMVPGPLSALQVVVNGEFEDPGSTTTGKSGAPAPAVPGSPVVMKVRGVDSFYNKVPSAADIVELSTTGANLPQTQTLASGTTSFSFVVFSATAAARDVVAMDLSNGTITASTSTPFQIFPVSVTSPTVSINISSGSIQTTLGGAISGTASDPSAVTQVTVALQRNNDGKYFDWTTSPLSASNFSLAAPQYATATLASPNAAFTSWSIGFPDSALSNSTSYYVLVVSSDPSNNQATTITRFIFNPNLGQVGFPGDGQGTAVVSFETKTGLPTSVGCRVIAASMTFTAGSQGINPGGAIAVHLPDNWTAMSSTGPFSPAVNPMPFAGDLVVGSPAAYSIDLNPVSQSSATFGSNWFLYRAVGGLASGQKVYFTMTAFTGGGPLSISSQTFTVLTLGDPAGLFKPIQSQPYAGLDAGPAFALKFADQQQISLGPLQTSATMQAFVTDACGNSTATAAGTLMRLGANINGSVADLGAQFYSGGSPVTFVALPGNSTATPTFYYETSTPGPMYEELFASATLNNGPLGFAARYAQVLNSAVGLSGVSVDTGTLMPGVSVATMTPGSFSGAAVVNFTLSNPNVGWEVIISSDGVTPLVDRNGYGQPGRGVSWNGLTETGFPNTLVKPGGPYYVKIRVGGGVVEDDSLRLYMAPSAFVYGTVNSTGAYAYVNAQGPNTNFANFAVASSTGYFEIYGLQNGGRYNIVATSGSVVNGQFVQLQSSSFNVTASDFGTDIGTNPFPTPTFLRLRVQLPQPAPFEFFGGFNAFSNTGQQAWGTLHYPQGADKSDSGAQSFGGTSSTWTIVGVTPGTYNLQINLPQVSISSTLPNVVIPPGTTTDLSIALQRKANVYGWAIIPSSTQYGTWVSVQGTKAGDLRPSVFGGAFMQGWQYGVGQTSAVYSLFGLDPGSWTVTARGQGFGSTSTLVYISSDADVGNPANGGLDLSLSSGTPLNGLVQIVGDSSNLPAASNGGVNVFINAYNPQTYSSGFAQVFVATDPVLGRSTFSITGLDPGTYFLNTWVQGTQAPQISTVVFSTGGFTTMNLPVDTAKAAVTVWLPGPSPDFSKVGLFYNTASTQPTEVQQFSALPGVQVNTASATWISPPLGPGYINVFAQYAGGAYSQASAQMADGVTTPVVLDLRGSSYTVSGTVVVAGNVNLNINGTAVSVSSVPGVLMQSTTNEYCLAGFSNSITTPTFHLELLPVSRQGSYLTQSLVNPQTRNTANNCRDVPNFSSGNGNGDVDPYLAYIVNISSDGSFSIPNVPPGGYILRVPTNLDSIYGGGPDELPPVRQFVRVTTSDVGGINFTISQGVSVSGLVRMPPGLQGNRSMQVSLNDGSGNPVRTAFVMFNNSNAAPFFLDRVPDGAYALLVRDSQSPLAFGAAPVTVKVTGVSLNQDIQLVQLGIIKGKLAVQQTLANATTAQYTVVDAHNASQLPHSFRIYADANPWIQGGHREADTSCGGGDGTANPGGCGNGGPAFDQNGQFSITGLLPGVYDVHFESENDPQDPSAIKLARTVDPGISVNGGGTTDLGTYNLTSALTLRGTVTDVTTGLPIANVPMTAQAALSQNREVDAPQATTDSSGTYQLVGLDPSVKVYDIYAGKRDEQGTAPPPYELQVAPSVDVTSVSVVNFALTPAPYSVSGRILGAAGGPGLVNPMSGGGGTTQVGAMVFLNKSGVQPHDNPIADVIVPTDAQGFFTIPALTTGTYKLTAVSLGYASFSENVAITSASVSLSPITLGLGATLTGALRKPDGSNPSQNDVDDLVAVTNNFSQLLIGQLTADDNAKTYTNYTISGFQPGLSYRLMVFGKGANGAPIAPAEGGNVVFSTTTETRTLDLVLRPSKPYVFTKSRRSGNGFALRFELSQPLRSRQASDNDLTTLLSTFSAQGTLSNWDLDSSRSILTAFYTPGVSESSFTVRLHGYSTQADPDSLDPVNPQFVYDSTFTYFLGLDGYYANVMANMNGGTLAIDDDPGRVAIGGGSFQVDASSTVKIALAIAQEALQASPSLQAAGLAPVAANIKAMRYGGSAYPSDVFRAVAATPPGVSPFSAFYNVFLPLGLRTSLQKPVPLTINYSTSTDPTTLNLYWYNAAANAYVLQQDVTGAKPVIDPVNHTITINVNHFSTFVLFNAGVAVISGNAFGGEFTAYNFPNPFDLSVKTVTAIHGGQCAGGGCSVRGTMISIGLPPDISGDGEVKIFDVAGERVRTLSLGTLNGGQYYYQPWDGRNDSGRDVASGVYIGQVKVGDHSKFFKMALIK